jgi:hypothetical protein
MPRLRRLTPPLYAFLLAGLLADAVALVLMIVAARNLAVLPFHAFSPQGLMISVQLIFVGLALFWPVATYYGPFDTSVITVPWWDTWPSWIVSVLVLAAVPLWSIGCDLLAPGSAALQRMLLPLYIASYGLYMFAFVAGSIVKGLYYSR